MKTSTKFFQDFITLITQRAIRWSPVFLTLLVIFVACGDLFLPEPYSNQSYTYRKKVNEFMANLFSGNALVNDKYNNKRIDNKIKQVEDEYKRLNKNKKSK